MPKQKGSPIVRDARTKKPRLDDSNKEASDTTFSSTNVINEFHVNDDNQVILPVSKPSLLPFEYPPLNLGTNNFRIIKILPGPEETPIQCTMRNTSMEDEDYVCLSYTWEPKQPFHDIELNGMIIAIGDNLWQFLRKARSAHIEEPLWIDALCINQSYHKEKNHQVALMGKIYKAAKRVMIWLGLDNMDGDMLGEVTKCALHLSRTYHGLNEDTLYKSKSNCVDEMVYGWNHDLRVSMKTSIAEFLSLPYWSRIWIIQEVMLPSKVMIYSGSEEVDLRSFAFVLVRLVCGWPLESKEEEAERCRNLPGFWFMRQKSSNRHLDLELPSLVRNFSNSSCNNKLDRVYAMLSLVKNGHELTIDYDATPETVLRRTMLSCMNKLPPGDWLIAGAILIEALEIWPSDFGEARSPTSNRCLRGKRERLDNSQIAIKCDHSMRISVPVLGEATICIRDSSTEVANWESAICIYLAISNAGDTHIFEYAIGNDASGFGVKYARAHEYVEGHSQNYEETLCHLNETLYFRLDSPSEQVYYLDYSCYKMVFPHYAAYPTTKSLIKWTSPRPKLVKETSTISTNDHSETRQYDGRRLMPANRKFR